MSEMVERVIRAIWEAESRPVIDDDGDAWQRAVARAAIAAMREPTEVMQTAGAYAYANGNPNDAICPSGVGDAWRAMIDEALK